jgi:RNA polymerase-binding transcription factor DksA
MPLTNAQRAHIEKRLHEERERTLQVLNGILADTSSLTEQDAAGDLSTMPFHPADLATDAMNRELDESNATRASRELAEIDAALERLYTTPADFGVCEEDGREIPFERLDIIPWARTCDEPARQSDD